MVRKKRAMKKRVSKEKSPLNKVDELKIEENWDDDKPNVTEPMAVSEWEEDWLFGDVLVDPEDYEEPEKQRDFEEENR